MSKYCTFGLLITFQLISAVDFEVYAAGMIAKGFGLSDLYFPIEENSDEWKHNIPAMVEGYYISKDRWMTYSKFINATKSTFNDIKLLYNDMDELNDELTFNNSQQKQTGVGSLITCIGNDCGIENYDRIGGSNSNINAEYLPIHMNANWNLDEIINIANETKQFPTISITAFFYNAYQFESSDVGGGMPWVDEIADRLFLNASTTTGGTFRSPHNNNHSRWGLVRAVYHDINTIYDNLGDPSEWEALYDEYYFEQSSASYVFIFGFSVECSDYDMYQKFMMGPVTTMQPTMQPTNDASSNSIHIILILLFLFHNFIL